MIYLDKTTRKLQMVLGGAITTNQLQCVVGFYDVLAQSKDGTEEYKGALQVSTSNNGTDVDICAAPGIAGTTRDVTYISVFNLDTVNASVTVKLDDGGTEHVLVKVILYPNESLVYSKDGGWQIIH
jgi:hypothetical protein